jgi:hypothetical protein
MNKDEIRLNKTTALSDASICSPTFDEMVGLIEKMFKESLEITKAFTADEIESEWQRYKILNHLYKAEQPTSNTQLPAEVLPKEWLEEIRASATQYLQGLKFPHDWPEVRVDSAIEDARNDFEAGATAYAIKLHQVQQENITLIQHNNRLKSGEEKGDLIYKQLYNDYKDAHALLEKVIHRHEGGLLPDRLLYNEIKSFLDGTKH